MKMHVNRKSSLQVKGEAFATKANSSNQVGFLKRETGEKTGETEGWRISTRIIQ